jgi:tRNA G18 (ribose-2'-O)-methylase SpoU
MSDTESLVFILHNIRSAHNVGSIFRSSDGIGVEKIYCVGYTPVPALPEKKYLNAAEKQIKKTALGAENIVSWGYSRNLTPLLRRLRADGFQVVGLEIAPGSIEYSQLIPQKRVALLLGNEIRGISKKVLASCDAIVSIPMRGEKESLNVSVAGAVAGYEICRRMKEGYYKQ